MPETPETETTTEAPVTSERRPWVTPDFSQIDLASARAGGSTFPDSTAG